MQFSAATLFTLASLITSVLADSQPFGVLSSHSASHIHLLPFFDDGHGLLLGSSDTDSSSVDLGFTITDAGKLKFSNGKFAVTGSDGALSEGDEGSAFSGWAITDGVVTLNGNKEFFGVPTDNSAYPKSYKVYTSSVANSNFFYMIGTTGDNNSHYTFVPSGVSNTADPTLPIHTEPINHRATTFSQAASTQAPATTSQTTQATSTVAQVSTTSTSSQATVSVQTENSANKLGLGISALAGVAALLL